MLVLASLAAGTFLQYFLPGVAGFLGHFTSPLVSILLILVGMQMGTDGSWVREWRKHARLTFGICACTITGSLLMGALAGIIDPTLSLRDGVIVSSGLGFYSLSSIMLRGAGLPALAALALVSNLLREVVSLAAAPVIVRYFGIFAPIAAMGSASDSGAPVIARASGPECMPVCVSCAFVLSACVPLMLWVLIG